MESAIEKFVKKKMLSGIGQMNVKNPFKKSLKY